MHFLSEQLEDYITEYSEKEPDILSELNRETHLKVLKPRMLSGHFQGRVLSMFSKLTAPKRILEIGTFTGYATLCLAEGLSQEGKIYTIDNNEELVGIQQKYFQKSDYNHQIIPLLGNALEIIPTLNEVFDLVFIDADKENYINYYNLIIPKMRSGGIILSDNVLWSGKVLETLNPKDLKTRALLEYNKMISTDNRVETVLLPIRDGLTCTRVK